MKPAKPITRHGVFNSSGALVQIFHSYAAARACRDLWNENHARRFYVQKVEVKPIPRKRRKLSA